MLSGIGVAVVGVGERNIMYYDAIVVLLIVLLVPVGAIVTLRAAGKKRHRRPVQNFRRETDSPQSTLLNRR